MTEAAIHHDFEAFADVIPAYGALIGLDPGTKTIGVAVSDALRGVATPIETIRRGKFAADAARIAALAQDRGAVGVVVGLPLNMDGGAGPRVQAVRAFARNLAAIVPLPISFWDERLSTVAVERTLIAADATRKKRAEVVDRMAAAYILQGALDRLGVRARASRGDGWDDWDDD